MKYLLATLALFVGLNAEPVWADESIPVAGKIPIADLTDDQAVDCMIRLMRLSNAANDSAKQNGISSDTRQTAETADDQASRGVSFYAAVLYSRPWIANRKAQSQRAFAVSEQQSAKDAGAMTEACLVRSLQAQSEVIDAALGKN